MFSNKSFIHKSAKLTLFIQIFELYLLTTFTIFAKLPTGNLANMVKTTRG